VAERRNNMHMSFAFMLVTGILTSVVVAELFQTVTVVVRRRIAEKPPRR